MNRSRAKRRLNQWRWYAQRSRALTANWWEDDRSTSGYVRVFRRWRWHAGAWRSRSELWWNTDPRRQWAKGMPETFVAEVLAGVAEIKEAEFEEPPVSC